MKINTQLSLFLAGLFWLFSGISYQLIAENRLEHFDISLSDGKVLRIQPCQNEIFRVKVSSNGEFQETIMERYGIIKTDWEPIKATHKKKGGKHEISTQSHTLTVDATTGNITVTGNRGEVLIKKISFIKPKDRITRDLAVSLDAYFRETKQDETIIGSENTGGGTHGQSQSLSDVGDPAKAQVVSIALKDGERFYGGGSTSRTNIQHRGTALRIWATYKKMEAPVPFLTSSEGWGIFNNTTVKNYFDIGRFQKDQLFVYNSEGDPDFYLLLGNEMSDVLNHYTLVTGRPYVMPKWAYGLAFGGNTMEDQMDLLNDALRFRDEKIPCDIFWIEPQWMEKRYDFSTAKNWNFDKFPAEPFWEKEKFPKYEHPSLFISRLHGLGFKLALWLCIDHDMSIAEEDKLASKKGTTLSGEEHWFDHLTRFIDQGVDGFKLDPAHTLEEHADRVYYNGLTDKQMHNLNQVLLPKQMYETFRSHKGVRSFHHYCGGYAGTQHWGASTSGDNGGDVVALLDQLNLGLSGFMNTSCDILVEVSDNKAAMHMGFFFPWVQLNSWYNLLHPWYMNPEEKETFRFYATLRNRLFPYIYSAALQGRLTGMPILRAMPLMFPDDRMVDNMTNQYMFGDNLLVGVYSDSVYLPKGNWVNFWTGETVSGGRTVHASVPETRGGALFIREGAIIPYQKASHFIGENPLDIIELKVYPHKTSSYTLLEDDGISFEYENGSVAKTKIDCTDTERSTEITIHSVEGNYKGMPQKRTWELEVLSAKKPTRVLVNGSEINDWKYENGAVCFKVVQEAPDKKMTIKFQK
ncbi:MAG: TIM-barrel domain-containing protein [Petrimonas sp.]|jgi:alpha-glucosidase (family GH31 glycosyl hydrolase)